MIDCIQKVEETMRVGDLVTNMLDEPQKLLGIVVAREKSTFPSGADAIIVKEHNGRISRWGEAWLEVLSASR